MRHNVRYTITVNSSRFRNVRGPISKKQGPLVSAFKQDSTKRQMTIGEEDINANGKLCESETELYSSHVYLFYPFLWAQVINSTEFKGAAGVQT